jgi:hypothetical protein
VSIKSGAWRLVGLGTLLVGCAQGSTTAGSALIHPAFPYAVTYDDEEKKSVLGDDWKLENYRRREQSSDIERKDGYQIISLTKMRPTALSAPACAPTASAIQRGRSAPTDGWAGLSGSGTGRFGDLRRHIVADAEPLSMRLNPE